MYVRCEDEDVAWYHTILLPSIPQVIQGLHPDELMWQNAQGQDAGCASTSDEPLTSHATYNSRHIPDHSAVRCTNASTGMCDSRTRYERGVARPWLQVIPHTVQLLVVLKLQHQHGASIVQAVLSQKAPESNE